jgi:hypothetical protein
MSARAAEQLFTEFRRWRNVVGWGSVVLVRAGVEL